MTVKVTKPAVNLREELTSLKKPSGIVGESILRADTAADAVEQLNLEDHTFTTFTSTGIDDNATSTALTLDSSGNLLVGTTNSAIGSNSTDVYGINLFNTGLIASSINDGASLILNRQNGDGSIAVFRKDGSTVGSIGAYNGNAYFGRQNTALLVSDTSDAVAPFDPTSAAVRDDAISLGGSTYRFKDLYLSGGVYLGGVGSSNKLDDVETGTFNPHIYDDDGQMTTHTGQANYVKIGQVCHITIEIYANGVSSQTVNGRAWIDIPFVGQARTNAIFLPHYYNGTGSINSGYVNGTVQRLYLTNSRDEPFGNNVGGTTIGGTMRLYGSLTYQTS